MDGWKYFQLDEFMCWGEPVPDHLIPNLDRLVRGVLDPVRERWKESIIVVSGYRDVEHNIRSGGKPKSQHLLAAAADIRPRFPRSMTAEDRIAKVAALYDTILEMDVKKQLPALGGLGLYPGRWLHVDVRPRKPSGTFAFWQGRGIGSEQ